MNAHMTTTKRRQARRGNITVLTMFFLVAMMAMLAFALDLGYIYNARTEMQRSADAAALAATWKLWEDNRDTLEEVSTTTAAAHARAEAERFAGLNRIGRAAPGLGDDDVVVGRYVVDDGAESISTSSGQTFNTVKISLRRTADQNGEIPLFFARVLGMNQVAMHSSATALYWSSFSGFQTPSDGTNLEILPIAIDRGTWESQILGGSGADQYRWNTTTKTISSGSDGIPEVNLYPQGTGSPGNRGTVDIGSSNNSTNDLKRQIVYGISPSDLEYHGGKLELVDGELELNADTGISAAIKAQLDQIKGKPRVIPIFDSVAGNGNNANYTITGFAGIRILDVNLTGALKNKKVVVQPAPIQVRGGIRSTETSATNYIYSPVVLIK